MNIPGRTATSYTSNTIFSFTPLNLYLPPMRNFLLLLFAGVFVIQGCVIQGCGSYSKMMKGDDMSLKEQKAIEYYNHKDYSKALPIFEELITYYKGTKKGEDLMYYYCYCYFGNEEYLLAAY